MQLNSERPGTKPAQIPQMKFLAARSLRISIMKSLVFVLVSLLVSCLAFASVQPDCARVCGDVRAQLKANAKQVDTSYRQWQARLGLKGDVVTYAQGFSAAEELLRFMSSYYKLSAPGNQSQPTFLAYMMGKCFPETHVDPTHAKMSGLVNTIWAAEHLKIETSLNTCK